MGHAVVSIEYPVAPAIVVVSLGPVPTRTSLTYVMARGWTKNMHMPIPKVPIAMSATSQGF